MCEEVKIRDVRMEITETVDEQFKRTALKMTSSVNTFNVLDRNGIQIAHIVVCDDNRYVSIDIVKNPEKTSFNRVIAMNQGKTLIETDLPETNKLVTCIMFNK